MTTKTSILITILLSTPAMALQAPNFVVDQMKSNPTPVFSNDFYNYAPVPGATASKQDYANTQPSDLTATVGLNSEVDPSWSNQLSNWNITIPSTNTITNTVAVIESSTASVPPPTRVVFNYSTGNLAVVTNELSIKARSNNDALALALQYNMKLKFFSDGLQRAFYEVDMDVDIINLKTTLMQSGLTEVIIDIMENEAVPN